MPLCLLLILSLAMANYGWAQSQSEQKKKKKKNNQTQSEEIEDYFKKWLEEDVVYIITEEEEQIFKSLSTLEEKDNFIEQFWRRRDPNPRTIENEFKEEHYRRIAYANEKFASGDPGWVTDRGRTYIIHGEPVEITRRPDGGAYIRPMNEGGGYTAVYPYEVWRYHYIEGLGNDIELEFVDQTNTGAYKLAVFAWEKDALVHIGGGPTLAEQTGLAKRSDNPYYNQSGMNAMTGPEFMYTSRISDTAFARYERAAMSQAAPELKYPDLKEMVDVNIRYTTLPFEVHSDYFKLNESQSLVAITVQVANKDLSFKVENGAHVARLAIYGMVTSMTNQYITEFEHDVTASFTQDEFMTGLQKGSVYQKTVSLDSKMRYKLDLVVKDLNSTEAGATRVALVPPKFAPETLNASPLLLSNHVEPLPEIPTTEEMFVLGDVRILPNLEHRFTRNMPLGVYLQVYNAGLDQTTLEPAIRVIYNLWKDGELLRSAIDEEGQTTQFFSIRRVVLVSNLSLADLEPGNYRIQVRVQDLLSKQETEADQKFTLVDDQVASLSR